jgi:small subunit ribosomal protein S20
MPNLKSAKKTMKVSEKRRKFNELKLAKIKQTRRLFTKILSVSESKLEEIQKARDNYFSALDKAAKTYLNQNKSNRLKSRSDSKIKEFLEIQKKS